MYYKASYLTNLKVKEAKTGDYVEKGQVLIAPGVQHMKIKKLVIYTRSSALKEIKSTIIY